jgi:hypothetical protein
MRLTVGDSPATSGLITPQSKDIVGRVCGSMRLEGMVSSFRMRAP